MTEKPTIPAPQYTFHEALGVVLAMCRRALAEVRALARIPGPPGDIGPEGKRGTTGERGEKGDRGEPGRAGSAGVAGLDGKDGKPGKDGRDGLSFDDIEQLDEPLRYGLRIGRGDRVKEVWWTKPNLADFDFGVWKEGIAYTRGAAVSFGGSLFIAHEDTSEKPEASKAWRLAVKRGRDGKDGKPGERGAPGPRGERGEQGQRGFPV